MNKKFDIAIIGSGIGGLTVGSLLSKDKKVLLVEKNSKFGGYCASFSRNGFRFESAIQSLNGLYKGGAAYEVFKKTQALKGVKIVRPRHLYRAIFPDYDIKIPQADLIKYRDMLSALFSVESSNIINLFDTLKCIYLEMRGFSQGKEREKNPYILKYGKNSVKELLDSFTKNEKLKAILSQYWMYRGLPPSHLSALTFAYIWYDYTANGSYFPKDGMRSIITNLVDSIRHNDGRIFNGKEVVKLLVKNNRVTTLELDDGKRYEAEAVVSNIDVSKTFDIIVNSGANIPEDFLLKLRNSALSISAFKIYLGLDVDIRRLGINDYEIFVNPSYDTESMYSSSLDNEFEKVPYSITIYSNLSNAFCGKNNSALSIGVLSGYDFWHNLKKSDYKQKKEEMADIILSRCEKIIPGLRKHITVKVIATPLTMERYTGNSKGSIYGWNKKSPIDEIRFMNPVTPIRNLFLSSHWTKMGGGVGGVLLSSNRVYRLISDRQVLTEG